MIAIIDYGAGNLQSVRSALSFIGCPNMVTASAKEIKSASGVILPGVGAFGSAMGEIHRRRLADTIKEAALGVRPFLGICAGMQLFFDESEESPGVSGLGIISGKVWLFPKGSGVKIPHVGWNSIIPLKNSKILGPAASEPYMYFVHSYFVDAGDRECVSAQSVYGVKFDVAVERGNLFGCQFHPEKSGDAGLSILKRFAELAGGGSR